MQIECYKGFPVGFESFLNGRYGSYTATQRYIEVFYPENEICHVRVSASDNLFELLIFCHYRGVARCLNMFSSVKESVMKACVAALFEEYPDVNKVIIDASYVRYSFRGSVLTDKSSDYLLQLPSSVDEYYALLGHSTRKNLRHQKQKILRDYPSVSFRSFYGHEITLEMVEEILKINANRMLMKGIVPDSERDADFIYRFCSEHGYVGHIEIEWHIVAVALAFMVGRHIFAYIIAHDDNFASYSPGAICQLYEIETAIQNGFSFLHFFWGDNEYKTRLLATSTPLFSHKVYRSRTIEYCVVKLRSSFRITFTKLRKSPLTQPLRKAVKWVRRKLYSQ